MTGEPLSRGELIERLERKINSTGAWVTSDIRKFYADIRDELKRLDHLSSGTVSLTSFDGHCVRIDFATRDEAEALFAALTTPSPPITHEED